jgi:hypothetical protein
MLQARQNAERKNGRSVSTEKKYPSKEKIFLKQCPVKVWALEKLGPYFKRQHPTLLTGHKSRQEIT